MSVKLIATITVSGMHYFNCVCAKFKFTSSSFHVMHIHNNGKAHSNSIYQPTAPYIFHPTAMYCPFCILVNHLCFWSQIFEGGYQIM